MSDVTEVKRDESIDISSLLSNIKEENSNKSSDTTEKKLDLDKKEEQPKNDNAAKPYEGKGLVINNKDFVNTMNAPKTNVMEKKIEDLKNENLSSMDDTMAKRERVTVIKNPTDKLELAQMMDEIESVVINPDGSASLNYIGYDGKPTEPTFIRLRKEGEAPFDMDSIDPTFTVHNNESGATNENNDGELPAKDDENYEGTKELDEEEKRKEEIVNIIIDKTGLGANIDFTDEEREKLSTASEVVVHEVEMVDIEVLNRPRSDKSIQDVIKEYDSNGHRISMTFPASGFRAELKGLTEGQYLDILDATNELSVDRYRKVLSVIYNNMVNISTGPFDSFEDFIKHFAYSDIGFATYALYLASEKEEQKYPLQCNVDGCKTQFDWVYDIHSLMDWSKMSTDVLDKVKEIATASASEYDTIKENAPVNNSKFIKLNESGYIAEIGPMSAYDYIENILPLQLEDSDIYNELVETYSEKFVEDARAILTGVRKIIIPLDNGEIKEAIGYKEILDCLYSAGFNDIQLIALYIGKTFKDYNPRFSIRNMVCPKCGHVTKEYEIDDIVSLIFFALGQRTITNIDLASIVEN